MPMPNDVRIARMKAQEENNRAAQQARAVPGRDRDCPNPAGLPPATPHADTVPTLEVVSRPVVLAQAEEGTGAIHAAAGQGIPSDTKAARATARRAVLCSTPSGSPA